MLQDSKGPECFRPMGPQTSHDLQGIFSHIRKQEGLYEGLWAGVKLRSAFQPIYSLAHKRITGFEALIRPFDRENRPIPPSDFFRGLPLDALVLADRLCRALHVANFHAFRRQNLWLFLNVATEAAVHARSYGPFFAGLLEAHGLSPASVVVEVVEDPSENSDRLDLGIAFFRDLGCLIAMDDFGAGASNFERIWRLSPHIVKLERGMIARAARESRTRRMLPGIVSLLHQSGALVLVEGIETEEEARIALESDADLVQGFFFGKPGPRPPETTPDFEGLFQRSKVRSRAGESLWREENSGLIEIFSMSLKHLVRGESVQAAFQHLLNHPRVLRLYLLDPSGVQMGPTLAATAAFAPPDPRFLPLEEGCSGDWFRRPYFKRALRTPGRVRVTQPYQSITGEGLCQTLSCHVATENGGWVACCDVRFEEDPMV